MRHVYHQTNITLQWFKKTVCAKLMRKEEMHAAQILHQTACTSNRTQAAQKMTHEPLMTFINRNQYTVLFNNIHEYH